MQWIWRRCWNARKIKKNKEFVEKFAELCANPNDSVPPYVINEILSSLYKYTDAPFPKTYGGLVGAPRSIKTIVMDDVNYCHFNLKDIVESIIHAYEENKFFYKFCFV